MVDILVVDILGVERKEIKQRAALPSPPLPTRSIGKQKLDNSSTFECYLTLNFAACGSHKKIICCLEPDLESYVLDSDVPGLHGVGPVRFRQHQVSVTLIWEHSDTKQRLS